MDRCDPVGHGHTRTTMTRNTNLRREVARVAPFANTDADGEYDGEVDA